MIHRGVVMVSYIHIAREGKNALSRGCLKGAGAKVLIITMFLSYAVPMTNLLRH